MENADILLDNGEITTEPDQNLVLNPADGGTSPGEGGWIIANTPMVQTANAGPPNPEEILPYEFVFYIDFLNYPNTEHPVPTLAVMARIPDGSGGVITQGPVINSLGNLSF
jgi:hypothetical protein